MNLGNFDIDSIIMFFSRLVFILVVAPIHEYAHAWMAKKQGDDTAALSGRLTLNPFAHIDPIGSILILLTGFGWAKPVPVNPLRMKTFRKSKALVAIAGPVSNIIFALIVGIIYNVMWCFSAVVLDYWSYAVTDELNFISFILIVLINLFYINIAIAIFNLIPVPPLDGSHILSYFTSSRVDQWMRDNAQLISFAFLGIIFFSSILSKFTGFIGDIAWKAVAWIPEVVGVGSIGK